MFYKVKIIEESGGWYVAQYKEKIINTNSIAMAEEPDQRKWKCEDKEVNVTKLILTDGKEVLIVGKVELDDKTHQITIIPE